MGRAPCCEKVGMKKGRWTSEEDEILKKYILDHGEGSWRSLPKNAGLSRCGKSCRLRWVNYLRDDLKRGNITKEEEETIVKLHTSIGNRWSVIAAHLPGRTDNEIKNYWNSHLSRKMYSFRHGISGFKPVFIDLIKVSSKQKGGRPTKKKKKQQQQQQQATNESTTRDEHEKSARSEQGEGMVIDSSNEKGRGGPSCESGPHLLMNEEGDEGPMGVNVGEEGEEGPSSYEEGEVDDWFDWDSEGSEAKIWDDIDDIWPMMWESGCKL